MRSQQWAIILLLLALGCDKKVVLYREEIRLSPKQKSRVLVIGGSTMYGFGLKDNETIASYLRRMRPDMEIIDLSIPGGDMKDFTAGVKNIPTSHNSHSYYPFGYLDYGADLILLCVCWNDLTKDLIEECNRRQRLLGHSFYAIDRWLYERLGKNKFGFMLYKGLFRWLSRNIKPCVLEATYIGQRCSSFRQRLSNLVELLGKARIRLVILPTLVYNRIEDLAWRQFGWGRNYAEFTLEYFAKGGKLEKEIISQVGKEMQAGVADCSNLIAKDLFMDVIHLNSKGNKEVAAYLLRDDKTGVLDGH